MPDLAVAYRIYPGVSKSPAFYSDDKYRLSEMCLRSFRSALGNLQVKVWALLDACPPEYEALFREILSDCDLQILPLERIGNLGTFELQINLLTAQTDAPMVYFAEDDYFYLPGAFEKMMAFMVHNDDVDFVTPYDHPDSYYTSSRHERHTVRPFDASYWRTASSTCLTFLTSRETLVRTQKAFRTYRRGNMDCPIWLSLTQKFGLCDPRVHWPNTFRLKTWLKTLRWGYSSILFGRRYRLWTPIPALATHMESSCLAPLTDWHALFVDSQRKSLAR